MLVLHGATLLAGSRCLLVPALQALVGLLEPAIGAQVRGFVEGLLPPKPASPAPATPTHAQIVAR